MCDFNEPEADDLELAMYLRLLIALIGDEVEPFVANEPPPIVVADYVRRAGGPQLRGLLIEVVAALHTRR